MLNMMLSQKPREAKGKPFGNILSWLYPFFSLSILLCLQEDNLPSFSLDKPSLSYLQVTLLSCLVLFLECTLVSLNLGLQQDLGSQ
jgi:hypothetical protein